MKKILTVLLFSFVLAPLASAQVANQPTVKVNPRAGAAVQPENSVAPEKVNTVAKVDINAVAAAISGLKNSINSQNYNPEFVLQGVITLNDALKKVKKQDASLYQKVLASLVQTKWAEKGSVVPESFNLIDFIEEFSCNANQTDQVELEALNQELRAAAQK